MKVPNGMSYILEVPHIIFGNFGSFSSDFVHFWKLLLGCCVFMEVPHGNCCILQLWKFLMGLCEFWKFLIRFCALLDVPRGIFLEVLRGILCILELPHGILCIFGSSSWDFVYF